jgi:serine/threonine-protein kinase RsbW
VWEAVSRVNEDEAPPKRFLADGVRFPAPRAGTVLGEYSFRLSDLPELRDFLAARARRCGMREERVSDLLIAVNEVATNAVTHGAAHALMCLWADDGDLVVGIHDDGRWEPEDVPGLAAPGPVATRGMGLWVARTLAAEITFDTGDKGTTVTMRFLV